MTPKTKQHETPKQPEVQPQPAPTPAPAPAPTPVAAAVVPTPANKQTATFDKLKAAWAARGIDTTKITIVPDGKFAVVTVGEGWPEIRIGVGGGIDLPAIKSYPKAFEAAVEGDKLLAKQNGRTAKAATPATPTVVTVKATVVPDQAKAADAVTPAQKKKQADAQLEAKLQQQA